jgi:DNA-binding HxlR family transcriptional regulator
VADALDVVGERWTLLIVRDLMFGPRRFGELRDQLPGLAPNLLSERLRSLREHGVIEQVDLDRGSSHHGYALTARGRQLSPVVHELARFGLAQWPDPDEQPPPAHLRRGALLSVMSPERLGAASWSAAIELPEQTIGVHVARPTSDGSPLRRLHLREEPEGLDEARAGGRDHARVRTTLGTLVAIRRGERTRADAERAGTLDVHASPRTDAQLALLLGW